VPGLSVPSKRVESLQHKTCTNGASVPLLFQYPPSGSSRCNLVLGIVITALIAGFQYPPSGSSRCNMTPLTTVGCTLNLSVPSKRVESLQQEVPVLQAGAIASFSTLQAGRVAATCHDDDGMATGGGLSVPSKRVESLQQDVLAPPTQPGQPLSVPSKRVESLQLSRCIMPTSRMATFSTLQAGRVAATLRHVPCTPGPVTLSVPSKRVESLQPAV